MRRPDLSKAFHSLCAFLPFVSSKNVTGAGNDSRFIFVNFPPNSQISSADDTVIHEPDSFKLPSYVTNKVRTSKYTLLNFIPKNLFEQFKRVANIYFLSLIFLQTVPGVGNGRQAAFLSTLSFLSILLLTMAKDGVEDYKRYRSDRELNNRKCQLLSGWRNCNDPASVVTPASGIGSAITMDDATSESVEPLVVEETLRLEKLNVQVTSSQSTIGDAWAEILWKEVRVGDIIKLSRDEAVPADLIILSTSEDDGLCFAETKNLDGETNLKSRQALKATCSLVRQKQLYNKSFFINSEAPGVDLYSYNASLNIVDRSYSQGQKEAYQVSSKEPISIQNTLLRGCIVRNVNFVVGLVVFTGSESKIVLNSGDTPSKRSYIEKLMNKQVFMNFIILFFLSLIVSIMGGISVAKTGTFADYFIFDFTPGETPSFLAGVIGFFTGLILFQNIVPVSLYLTVEVVKSVQAYFIYRDLEMYYEPLDIPCIPKAWNLSDDLGQIEYIFSDKTGTLTQNVMIFRQCSIGGVMYGDLAEHTPNVRAKDNTLRVEENRYATPGHEEEASDDNSSISTASSSTIEDKSHAIGKERDRLCQNNYRSGPLTFFDHRIYLDLINDPVRAKNIRNFFTILALCHTVLAEVSTEEKEGVRQIAFNAESPDEAALVAAATNVGFTFLSRHQDKVQVNFLGEVFSYRILHVLEFNSTRKRMSIILQASDSDEILLFCKGADSIIMDRLGPDCDKLKKDTLGQLEIFAKSGLRTLCVASRVIPASEYREWDEKYREALNSLDNREMRVMTLCENIENGLSLVGGTAIEDKLQDGVPESIALLREAGIKIWVLTGDKVETAINIGYSCNLLSQDMMLVMIQGDDTSTVETKLDGALLHAKDSKQTQELALVIDGPSLRVALEGELKHKLLQLGQQCKTVVCCRVSPLQKAQVVSLVKDGLNVLSLAIGDGANDVSMIQAAHVGVGIAGLEGYQAVMASDYAIAQFRFLARLLLVHGRWSYTRIARMILCFFYKNLVMTLTNFWFQFFNGSSQNFLYEYPLVLCYNLFFTAFPVAVLGSFDQDIRAEVAMVTPQLYRNGITHEEYTHRRFYLIVLDATYQSLVCFFIPLMMFDVGTLGLNGESNTSLDGLGTLVVACVVATTNLYVGVWTFNWTWMMFAVIGASIAFFFCVVFVMSRLNNPLLSVDQLLFTTPTFWLVLILVIMLCLLPRLFANYVRVTLRPTDVDLIREQVLIFSNYICRQSRRLLRQRRRTTLQSKLTKSHLGLGRFLHPTAAPYCGYAFSMDEDSPVARRIQNSLLQTHLMRSKHSLALAAIIDTPPCSPRPPMTPTTPPVLTLNLGNSGIDISALSPHEQAEIDIPSIRVTPPSIHSPRRNPNDT
ncbi:phospholipid transporting ATPase [Entomophthora muscae]|uniref:Phospholipid transporting ATPase n=1 Tax=Entomophthora muscae TaxID=34485 RepID=A0ACC2SG47_9FUNG|nr:phospholipid transporting ATPase [Entomophthora muscae]